MPHSNVTIYDLLLSCPEDVIDFKNIIADCVENFNDTIGNEKNIRIDLKHWTTHSYPQLGDSPQSILNKQFIMNCDLCVALLWTRFGTPTTNYDSGTEEEIENMILQNKQVFLYFVDKKVEPSKIDLEQYKKVKAFKKKYSTKGIYCEVKTEDELKEKFQRALAQYFEELPTNKGQDIKSQATSSITISSLNLINDTIIMKHSNFTNTEFVITKKEEIIKLFYEIQNMKIETQIIKENDNMIVPSSNITSMTTHDNLENMHKKIIESFQSQVAFNIFTPKVEKVVVPEFDKKLIQEFCNKYNLNVPINFWSLGNLHKETNILCVPLNCENSAKYVGSDLELQKHKLIDKISTKIIEFNAIIEYFTKIDALYNVSFFVENNGTKFDEDIDVCIYIDKGCVTKLGDIPTPQMSFFDENIKYELPKIIFIDAQNAEINEYSNYPTLQYIPKTISFSYNNIDDIREYQLEYSALLENIFCYKMYENASSDILTFNIPYLKHNTKMFFPSVLLFSKIPKSIRFEIKSKYSANVYQKEISTVEEKL